MSIHVYKFGGTSVGTPERVKSVVHLVAAEPADAARVVVVSAFGGVTDDLLAAMDAALARSGEHVDLVAGIHRRHEAAIGELVAADEQERLRAEIGHLFRDLRELLDGVYLLRECTPRTRDAIIGVGERASAPLVAAAFRAAGHPARAFDARQLIRTDDAFGEANVDFSATRALVNERLDVQAGETAIVTGFIASTHEGVQTTLGRSGSDYSATILAGALDAERVVIWTDVDGVLSADPRLVPAAFTLPYLSYREAGEMAYFGAKVLHPRTMRPLLDNAIPLEIKNTMNPTAAGTRIQAESVHSDGAVKAVTAIRGVALVMVEGAGMVGVPGISGRTFSSLAAAGVNVLLISQASSEQSICIGVREEDAQRAQRALQHAFELEIMRGDIQRIHIEPGCAVVSVVGDQMRMQPGIAGRMFSTLGYANINVRAIAQGASETNISAVVADQDAQRAIRALHEGFARSFERAHLFLLGTGVVGKAFLELLSAHAETLSESRHLNLRLVGVANSRRHLMDAEGLDPALVLEGLDTGEETSLDRIVDALQSSHLERLILIDATASEAVAQRYEELLEAGIGVVTPNKRANTGDLSYFHTLRRTAARRGVPFLYETTVGAGLPVISTLADLVASGDRVLRIDGVLSGTLAFVFAQLKAGRSFSEAVLAAREAGFTEPDPRDDLGGEDVARKILTLARVAGWQVERGEIAVESLVPAGLADLDVPDFLQALPQHDGAWSAGRQMQYVATADADGVRVGIQTLEANSPFAGLQGTDNMIVFTTERYRERPLVIQGAGAGPGVTSAGMMADVVRAAEAMR
ncbi:MAG: bifunctional aspartate kinase/homoserine dehydrogenase I [Rhodothermales bacterium]|nr:bifunctional aspartate kinase/homoserine dehydrogenase I [Rhodothermales bacterium]MBO6779465.1 bifunctional aspartate kinase/homoserine dehydrogenase I [Rhodothermales bacterium]